MKTETENITQRRLEGEFFTPIRFAKTGLNYIAKIVGEEWWKSGEYRLWDMAAGTGNLVSDLPIEALAFCYLSTINTEDVEYCKQQFPKANCFQYDYLNDDVENLFLKANNTWKLHEKLRSDLQNANIKWIVLVNPPFATSQTAGAKSSSKAGVSNTKVRKIMHDNNLGEVSRELFSQFIFRIKKEFENKTAYLALFSKIKYLNANNDYKLREQFFDFSFEKGFMFSSANFAGTSQNNQFPIGFLIWNLSESKRIDAQHIEIDIYNRNVEKIGTKQIVSDDKNKFLSKWIKRPPAINKFPPVGSAINIKTDNKDTRNRIANGFLASLMCAGNSFQSQSQTALFSMPSASAGALSVTPENFEKAMVVHAVRRIPKANWINDRDQFLQPKGKLTDEFIYDCTVWSILSNSNQTVALKNVSYENETYQVNNHFFPFQLSEIENWRCSDSKIFNSMTNAENRFLANWLSEKKLSIESRLLLNKAKEIYEFYFENLNQLPTTTFKIETWDAGWWQIRKSLAETNRASVFFKELKKLHNQLGEKLLQQIEEINFFSYSKQ